MTETEVAKAIKLELVSIGAQFTPASPDEISTLEKAIKQPLSTEYKAYLNEIGTILLGGQETYGLGVGSNYYLNVWNAYKDLSETEGYPTNALPLMNIDDETYFLYDNRRGHVLTWRLAGDISDTNDALFTFLRTKFAKS